MNDIGIKVGQEWRCKQDGRLVIVRATHPLWIMVQGRKLTYVDRNHFPRRYELVKE